jgi:predicted nucleic acid-binding protein
MVTPEAAAAAAAATLRLRQLLTETGRHRSAGPVDLLIAATAECAGLIILCDDRDFQTVASVTGQPVKLVADV